MRGGVWVPPVHTSVRFIEQYMSHVFIWLQCSYTSKEKN